MIQGYKETIIINSTLFQRCKYNRETITPIGKQRSFCTIERVKKSNYKRTFRFPLFIDTSILNTSSSRKSIHQTTFHFSFFIIRSKIFYNKRQENEWRRLIIKEHFAFRFSWSYRHFIFQKIDSSNISLFILHHSILILFQDNSFP